MVRARKKRLTRKDLRQPDQFMTLTARLLEIFQQNRTVALLSLSMLIAAFLALWGWQLYKGRQNRLAAQEFAKAVELYHARQYQDALNNLQKVESFRWSTYYDLSLLYQANTYLAMNQKEKAAEAARRFVQERKEDPLFGQIGLLTLAYVQEEQTHYKEAVRLYKEAEALSGPFKEKALLGKARCSLRAGDNRGALAAYRQYLTEFPGSPMAPQIALRVAGLEAKGDGGKEG